MNLYFSCRSIFNQCVSTTINSKSHRRCTLPPDGSRCLGLWALSYMRKKEICSFPIFFKSKQLIMMKEQTHSWGLNIACFKATYNIFHNCSDYSITMVLNYLLSLGHFFCTGSVERPLSSSVASSLWCQVS